MKRVEDKVLEYITRYADSENPATRRALSIYCGANDREVREAVKWLRQVKKQPIVSFSGKRGYWLAESKAEIDRFKAECRHRARDLYETAGSVAYEKEKQEQTEMPLDAQ